MEKMSRLKEELRLTEAGFVENVELLPKHTNSLPIKVDDKIKPYKKVDAILIPENATNGNMMKALFPNLKVEIEGIHITCWIDEHRWFAPDYDWWYAPYKRESEDNND